MSGEITPQPGDRPPHAEQHSERYGPVNVVRTRKDDGRLLLLFSRREGDDDERDGAHRRP